MKRTYIPPYAALLLAVLALTPLAFGEEGRNPEDDTSKSTIDDLFLGEYWFGAEVEDEDLQGKVVLFEIWGSCVGCRQVTPKLVKLAKRMEGKPFHLIASHCQAASSERETISYLKANGMSAFAPNLTITSNGVHPDVKGTGFMPYYIVFDHTGKLHYHHMSGSYHGGDGDKFIGIVNELVAKAPAIYLGKEGFEKIDSLAEQVSKGKGLGSAMKKIDAGLADAPDEATKAELERLGGVLKRYRDRKLAKALAQVGGQPSEVIPDLKKLLQSFKGSSLATEVETKLSEMEGSADLKTQIWMEKKFRSIQKKYDKTKEKKRTDAFISSTVKKLDELLADGNDELPYAATVEALLAELR